MIHTCEERSSPVRPPSRTSRGREREREGKGLLLFARDWCTNRAIKMLFLPCATFLLMYFLSFRALSWQIASDTQGHPVPSLAAYFMAVSVLRSFLSFPDQCGATNSSIAYLPLRRATYPPAELSRLCRMENDTTTNAAVYRFRIHLAKNFPNSTYPSRHGETSKSKPSKPSR